MSVICLSFLIEINQTRKQGAIGGGRRQVVVTAVMPIRFYCNIHIGVLQAWVAQKL
jgi:hypothetical protein